jgi:hypothetical protein
MMLYPLQRRNEETRVQRVGYGKSPVLTKLRNDYVAMTRSLPMGTEKNAP